MNALRLLPRFRRARRALDGLRAREAWDRSSIEAYQLQQINALWARATNGVPYYRDLARTRRLPPTFESLAEFSQLVPVLDQRTVRLEAPRLVSEQPRPGRWHRTGGSTGPTKAVYWESRAHLEALQAKYRFLEAWGVDLFDRAAFVWGHAASVEAGWHRHLMRARQAVEDRLRNRLRLSAYALRPADLRDYLDRIAAFRPAYLYAYSTAAFLLAREARARSFRSDALRVVVVTSEPARPYIIQTIEAGFGAQAAVEYGSMDAGLLAFEYPDRILRVREDIVFLETVASAGSGFEIIVTGLLNHGFPLIRYAIGDRTDCPIELPPAGFARLSQIIGRSNDLLLASDGSLLHPNWFDEFFEHEPSVRRWQLHQKQDGSVRVRLEVDPMRHPPGLDQLSDRLERQLRGFPVRIVCLADLGSNPAGKHTWITSELTHQSLTDDEQARPA